MRAVHCRPSPAMRGILALSLLVVACGGRRSPYPIGPAFQFEIQCVQNLWPGSPAAPLDVREAFCDCLTRRCGQRYDVEQLDQIRLALARGGYRTDAAGVPPAFVRLVDECKDALDRGALPVE